MTFEQKPHTPHEGLLGIERELQELEQKRHRLENELTLAVNRWQAWRPVDPTMGPRYHDVSKMFACVDRGGSAEQEAIPLGSLRVAECLVSEFIRHVPELMLPEVERGASFPILNLCWPKLTWAISYPNRAWPTIHVRAYGYPDAQVNAAVIKSFYLVPSLIEFSKEYV